MEALVTPADIAALVHTALESADHLPTTSARVAALTLLKREVKKQETLVNDRLGPAEQQMLEELANDQVDSKRDSISGALVGTKRRIWARAKDGDKEAAISALRAAGLGAFVSEGFNTTSLSSHFNDLAKECDADGVPVTDDVLKALLPDVLHGYIELTADTSISVTKAKG